MTCVLGCGAPLCFLGKGVYFPSKPFVLNFWHCRLTEIIFQLDLKRTHHLLLHCHARFPLYSFGRILHFLYSR